MYVVLNKALIHLKGLFPPNAMNIHVTRRKRKSTPAIDRSIEKVWMKNQGGTDSCEGERKLSRLVAFSHFKEKIILYLGETTWREYVGTNLNNPDIYDSLDEEYLANPLKLIAMVVSRDQKILLKTENKPDGEYLDFINLDAPFSADKKLELFRELWNGIFEQTEIPLEYLESLSCIGMVENLLTHQPGAVCLAEIDSDMGDILELANESMKDQDFHYTCVDSVEQKLPKYLIEKEAWISPEAAAGLALLF